MPAHRLRQASSHEGAEPVPDALGTAEADRFTGSSSTEASRQGVTRLRSEVRPDLLRRSVRQEGTPSRMVLHALHALASYRSGPIEERRPAAGLICAVVECDRQLAGVVGASPTISSGTGPAMRRLGLSPPPMGSRVTTLATAQFMSDFDVGSVPQALIRASTADDRLATGPTATAGRTSSMQAMGGPTALMSPSINPDAARATGSMTPHLEARPSELARPPHLATG
jgi:hypothetical protein